MSESVGLPANNDFWTPDDKYDCDVEGCYRKSNACCDMCDMDTCPEHTVRLGENECYCPFCNPRVR